ncbi:hypothetical protein RMN56_11325 [Micromonospora halotolerans]|uniref:Gram-positive cocci surface proteins LPxTG domain-containing protein n=1 Tax=Micromonospora halotolerans TaxID=709879 RepID=A0ABZ0A376_9ACTN|nr:hypothetical protein [Micromonospora halotolerans]WNM41883.1 hypothetical protein RMN56_11325 [Micromonospora halotolerans]
MVMVNLPAARRHHRSRIGYAFGLLAFLGVATALALVVRHPAFSATQELTEPVPAPEITVAGEGNRPATEEDGPAWVDPPVADARAGDLVPPPTPDHAGGGTGAGEAALAEHPSAATELSRSLFYSGLLGLGISLAGLGLVGTRRRQW